MFLLFIIISFLQTPPVDSYRFSRKRITSSYVVQLPSHVWLFETPWTAAHQASLSLTISKSLQKFMFIASVMPSISSSDDLVSFCPWSFPALGTFQVSHLFTSDDQNTGTSAPASVLPVNIQGWFALGLTGLISLIYSLNNFHIYHTAVLIILIMLDIISMVLSYLISGSLYVLTIFIYLYLFPYLFGIFLSGLSVRKKGCC